MKKHHVYIAVGGLLAALTQAYPAVFPLHGAGLGVVVAGLIDWYHDWKAARDVAADA